MKTKQDQCQQFREDARSCRKCSLGEDLVDSYDPHVLGQGSLDAKLFFVAETPGLQETIHQRPLTTPGKSGAIYEKLLTSLGLTRNQVYTTNTLICRPPSNREPLPYECLACRPWLVSQLDLVQPKLVVTFGRLAASTFLSDFKITKDHGQVLRSPAFNVDVFPLYHPSYVGCYSPASKREEFKVDVAALKRLLKGYV
jgi:uracil-DNA glycosylase family 4